MTAWIDLATLTSIRNVLDEKDLLQPEAVPFPELRSTGPDLSFFRSKLGSHSLCPVRDGSRFVIVRIPDLEIRSLAICLNMRYGDDRLGELLQAVGVHGLREELLRRASDQSLENANFEPSSSELEVWFKLCQAALDYFPRGVSNKTLETWLLGYEYGIKPTAVQIAKAWSSLVAMIPSLLHYCSAVGNRLVARNLGITTEQLQPILSAMVVDLELDSTSANVSKLMDLLVQEDSRDVQSISARLFGIFTSRTHFPRNPLAKRSFLTTDELVKALLGSNHSTPTGRIYGHALPFLTVGRDHIELADGIRKAAYYALVAEGFRVVGFAGDEFAVLIEAGDTDQAQCVRAETAVKHSLTEWGDLVAMTVKAKVAQVW